MRAVAVLCVLIAGCAARISDGVDGFDADETGSGSRTRCGPIDVVFAIDNSGSMLLEHQALRERAFPPFARSLKQIASDFRVGVLDACDRPATLHTRGARGPCDFAGGNAWMESSSPRLDDELACVADMYSGDAQCTGNNDDEQPLTSVAAALGPAWSGPGLPNHGFSRSEALLVVVAITDEDEHTVPGASPRQLRERLVAAKGRADRLVVAGIGGAGDCVGPYGPADDAEKLREVTGLFGDRGLFWDLCEGDLPGALAATVEVVAAACGD